MSVTLVPKSMSNFCPITAFYVEIPDFYAEVPSRYAKIPTFYADICFFGFRCAGNGRGRALVCRLRPVRTRGEGEGRVGGKNIVRVCARNYLLCYLKILF